MSKPVSFQPSQGTRYDAKKKKKNQLETTSDDDIIKEININATENVF